MAKKKFNPRKAEAYTRQIDQVTRHLRAEFKNKGLPIERAIDYAIRVGLRRQHAVAAANRAYGKGRSTQWVRFVQGGGVSPR